MDASLACRKLASARTVPMSVAPFAPKQVAQVALADILDCRHGEDLIHRLRETCGDGGPCARVWSPGQQAPCRCKFHFFYKNVASEALMVVLISASTHPRHDMPPGRRRDRIPLSHVPSPLAERHLRGVLPRWRSQRP